MIRWTATAGAWGDPPEARRSPRRTLMRTKLLVLMLIAALLMPLVPSASEAQVAAPENSLLADRASAAVLRTRPDLPIVAPDEGHDHHGHVHTAGGDDQQDEHGDAHSSDQMSATGTCDKDINRTGRAYRMAFVAAYNNGLCHNTDLDVYQQGTRFYVVQGAKDAAYTHYDVTNRAKPVLVKQYRWAASAAPYTRVQDIQHFKRGTRQYLALALERGSTSGYCGVVVLDVSSPKYPARKSQYIGSNWCDTHNLFVETDTNGNGIFIYATANYTKDVRVLDISGKYGGTVSKPNHVGRYRSPNADPYGPGYGQRWVHDVTVVNHGGTKGRRVYLAYWYGGVIVLRATNGSTGVVLRTVIGPGKIDPSPSYRAHHAVPNSTGTRLFIQDEFMYWSGSEPVQMWDIGGPLSTHPPHYIDGLKPNVGVNGQLLPAHNLYVLDDFIYVAWYKGGLQGYSYYGEQGFSGRERYHQVQTEGTDGDFEGVWGIERLVIKDVRYLFQSDQRYGLIISKAL